MTNLSTGRISVFTGILLCSLATCNDETMAPAECIHFPDDKVFENLAEYNLFEEPLAALKPRNGVLPYDLNAPLFSDYAHKQRFVYVPKGKPAMYDTTGPLDFPVGTILVKNFSYALPAGGTRIVETRLLLHQSTGWDAEVYEWNEKQTEAKRIIVGKEQSIRFVNEGGVVTTRYQIPNKNQCKNCHGSGNEITPIGPRIGNLNKTYDYETGPENQVDRWVAEGIVTAPPGVVVQRWPDYTDASADLGMRARVYLEVNCSHCHRRQGAASNTGLYLQYYNYDSLSYGFSKPPVAAGDGSGDLLYDIVPGDAEHSILYYRMNSAEVEVRMPELGRNLIDERGVSLIKEWIDAMK